MAPLLQADERLDELRRRPGARRASPSTLHEGEILGLIGPNGAGKTTMFNCITGVVPGYRGDIRYDGRDLRHLKPHQRARLKIARTFQNLELFDELSALDNLVLPLDAFSRRGVIGDLLRLPTTVFDERTAQEKARAILHFLEPRRLRRHAGRRPAGRSAAASRDRTRALSRAAAAAPRRAGVRARRAGDGRPGRGCSRRCARASR